MSLFERTPIYEKTVVCYTDGSANVKNGLGGCGVYMIYNGNENYISKGFSNTKTGRMEIMAGIECLKAIKDKTFKVVIYSDSQYFVNSINKGWVYTWEKDGLILRTNGDLWTTFLQEYRKFKSGFVILNWVKGHNDNIGNETADRLADYKQFEEYIEDYNPYEDSESDIQAKKEQIRLRDLKLKFEGK